MSRVWVQVCLVQVRLYRCVVSLMVVQITAQTLQTCQINLHVYEILCVAAVCCIRHSIDTNAMYSSKCAQFMCRGFFCGKFMDKVQNRHWSTRHVLCGFLYGQRPYIRAKQPPFLTAVHIHPTLVTLSNCLLRPPCLARNLTDTSCQEISGRMREASDPCQ